MTTASTATTARTAPARTRGMRQRTRVIPTLIGAVIAVLFIVPAVWILTSSLRTDQETFSTLSPVSWKTLIPTSITFENYRELLLGSGFAQALGVSVVACLLSVALGLVITVPAAYALGVLRFRFQGAIFATVVVGFMVPFEAVAIPLAQQFTTLGLANTLMGLVLPGIGNGLAIFNMRQYFRSVPPTFREAAIMDGASELRVLWSVYRPISGPAMVNSALLIFLGQWSSYLWPLLVITNSSLQVAPVALAHTFSDHEAHFGQNFAGTIILSLIPAALMFLLQRSFGGVSLTSGEK
jgi:putative chitobiose transport system permease protein